MVYLSHSFLFLLEARTSRAIFKRTDDSKHLWFFSLRKGGVGSMHYFKIEYDSIVMFFVDFTCQIEAIPFYS